MPLSVTGRSRRRCFVPPARSGQVASPEAAPPARSRVSAAGPDAAARPHRRPGGAWRPSRREYRAAWQCERGRPAPSAGSQARPAGSVLRSYVAFDSMWKTYTLTLKGQMTHRVRTGSDARGNLVRIENALDKMQERLRSVQEQLENLYNQQAAAKTEVGKLFPQEDSHAVQYPRRFLVLDNSDIDAMLRIIYEERGLTPRAMTFSAAREMIRDPQAQEGAAVLSRSHHAVARDAAAEISAGRGPGRHHFLWLSLPAEEMLRAGLQRSSRRNSRSISSSRMRTSGSSGSSGWNTSWSTNFRTSTSRSTR